MNKGLKLYGSPDQITTDGLRSNRAAMTKLGDAHKREIGRWAYNRVEGSHRRE